MELSIKNFRSIRDEKYIFSKGNTLITGESGAGKSTILESIIWCFYGGPNVLPYGNKKKIVTKTEIKIDEMIITRTKPPDKCQILFKDGKKLEHDEAQSYIDKMFGSKNLWETSSYLKQDNRSNLLFSSGQEKFHLVKEIIFGGENKESSPEFYLDKLSVFSKNIDTELNVLQGKIEISKETLNNSIENFNSYDDMEKNKQKLSKSLSKYEAIYDAIEKLKSQISLLEMNEKNKEKLKIIIKELTKFPSLSLDLIQKWKIWHRSSEELSKYDTSIEKVICDDSVEDLETDLKFLERDYKEYKLNSDKCKRLNGNYDQEDISDKILETESEIEKIKAFKNYSNLMDNIQKIKDSIQNIEENIKKLNQKEKPYSDGFNFILKKMNCEEGPFNKDKMSELTDKLSSVQTDYLKCPHCNKNTVLEKNTLIIKECSFMKKQELEKIKKNLNNISQFYEKKKKLDSELENYQEMLSKMKIPEKVKEAIGDVSILKKYIFDLNSVTIIDYDKDLLESKKSLLKRLRYQNKIESLQEEIEKNYDSVFTEYKVPDNFNTYFEKYKRFISEKEILECNIKELENKNLEESKEKLEKLSKTLTDLDNFKLYQQILEKNKKIESLDQEYKILMVKRESCSIIKKIIEEESALTFENMIQNFNDTLNEIVGEIFEDISIQLGMFKKLKSRGELKPQFNMKVFLKGNEYDNLNFLSGGEKDRISIALTLTLSTLLNTPIIMFDESMSSLDEEMRERCLELIKKYAGDKILINICHSTVEGYYDTIIRK